MAGGCTSHFGLACHALWHLGSPRPAFNFDPEEFAERLPDLTGVNDSIVAELLVMAEKTCLHSPSLSLPNIWQQEATFTIF